MQTTKIAAFLALAVIALGVDIYALTNLKTKADLPRLCVSTVNADSLGPVLDSQNGNTYNQDGNPVYFVNCQ